MAQILGADIDGKPLRIDLGRFVKFEPSTGEQHYRVGGIGGRRSGEVGLCAGVIGLRHSAGYEVLLQFSDGKVESFSPHALLPVLESTQ